MKTPSFYVLPGLAVLLATLASPATAPALTLRVVTYNIAADVDGYTAARPGLNTVLEAIGQQSVNGIAQPADIIGLEETTSNAMTVAPLANSLNDYYGVTLYGTSNYQGTEVNNSPTTGNGPNGVLYNTKTLVLLASTGVGTPQGSTNGEYRQIVRYEFQPVGSTADNVFYVYVSHMKSSSSGTASAVQAARALEAQMLRADSATLPAGAGVIYTGDFNLDGSFEAAYQTLTAAGVAQGVDPFNYNPQDNTETWDTALYTPILTESATSLHYRDDIQFISANVFNGTAGGGMAYVAGSYRTFGNNGTASFEGSVNSSSNTALNNLQGPISAATALSALTTASDHLPVVADYSINLAPPPPTPAPAPAPTPTPFPQVPRITLTLDGAGEAVEDGEKCKVLFTRTGDTSSALMVQYKVKGTAIAGTDYVALPGEVTFMAGAAQARVKIKATGDPTLQGTRAVKIKLLPATGGVYLPGSSVVVKVLIVGAE